MSYGQYMAIPLIASAVPAPSASTSNPGQIIGSITSGIVPLLSTGLQIFGTIETAKIKAQALKSQAQINPQNSNQQQNQLLQQLLLAQQQQQPSKMGVGAIIALSASGFLVFILLGILLLKK